MQQSIGRALAEATTNRVTIEFARPQRPPEPTDNPYDVYQSLAVYTAQAFQNDFMLAYAERELSLSRSRVRLEQPEPRHPVAQRWGGTNFQALSRIAAYSTCRVLLLGCATGVRAYKWRHGVYPPTLSEAGVEDLNRDPFTGEQFVYKPSSTGFLLYSVGEDGVDDGGKRVSEQGGTRGDVTLLPFYGRQTNTGSVLGTPLWWK